MPLPSTPAGSAESDLVQLFDLSIGMLAVVGLDGNFRAVSPAFEQVLGHPKGELLRLGWEHFVHPDDLVPTRKAYVALAGGGLFERVVRFRRADGTFRWLSWHARKSSAGDELVYAVASDVTSSLENAEAARDRDETFRIFFQNAPIGMGITRIDGTIDRVNDAFARTLGYDAGELVGRNIATITHAEDTPPWAERDRLLRGEAASFQVETRFVARDGRIVNALLQVGLLRNAAGAPEFLVGQFVDITERKKAEERLQHAALHDALTGLPNGVFFRERLAETMQRARRAKNANYAVLFVDLDRFKVINDSLGHKVGDELLVAVARRLRETVRTTDLVARHGGDEFTVLLDSVDDAADCARLADRMQDALSEPLELAGHEVTTSASVGIAPGTLQYGQPDELLRDADIAMYRAKAQGGGRHVIFDSAMHERAMAVLQLETDLRQALQRHELAVHYQPIIKLEGGAIEGFEALLRWQHPTRGMLSPAAFLQVAEDTGLIRPIGWWLLRTCVETLKGWDAQLGTKNVWMSINLSNRQFLQSGLVDGISTILAAHDISPSRLRIEITETVAMHDAEAASALLGQLRALGTPIDIDDFGTGYSSLAHLHRFPIDTLKIDRSFVMRMSETSADVGIVGTIVRLASSLGIDVTAEGVETAEQLARVRALGCGSGQGYFFAPPVPLAEATRLLGADPRW